MKSKLKTIGAILLIAAAIYSIGQVKYWIWRAEHPHAETWTFFIPEGKR